MNSRAIGPLLKETYAKWSDHHASRLGASVAFYTLLSLAPLLMLAVAVVSLVFSRQQARDSMIAQAGQMVGSRGADTVKLLLQNAHKPSTGIFAGVIAFVILLFGASGVFTELREALNIIWEAKPNNESGLAGMIKERLFSFGMVLAVGILLLVTLIVSAGLAFIGKHLDQAIPIPAFVFEIINFLVSFVIITVLFAAMFKYVPAASSSWRNVLVGAVGAAILFAIGKLLLGLYLGKASVGSGYGVAGSLVAVIVWVYYSAQIFFFGAEFARVYENRHVAVQGSNFEENKNRETPAREVTLSTPDWHRDSAASRRRTSRPSLLIAAAIAYLLGRNSAKSKRSD